VEVSIRNLDGDELGLANADVLLLDDDASGYGWYIDATPRDDSEFRVPGRVAGMDLLTVAAHEMGHVLGLPDLPLPEYAGWLMADALAQGERRSPTAAEALALGMVQ